MEVFLPERESVSMLINNTISKLTALIVDDELFGRENLKKIIETYCHEVEVIGTADSAVSAKKIVQLQNPEVVFLDINMPVLDGFDFLEEYNDKKFMVVFVSAHEEYGIKAVKAGADDYLLKPINIKELKQTIKKLLTIKDKKVTVKTENPVEKIMLPAAHGFDVLLIDNIIRIEAEGCYTKVILKESKNVIVSRTLKDFEDTVPKEKFLRVHKSHLINLKHIKDYSRLSGNYVTMTDGSKVEISRRKVSVFIQKIKTVLKTV